MDRVLVESAERRERRANLELLDLPEDEEDQEMMVPKETQYENPDTPEHTQLDCHTDQ